MKTHWIILLMCIVFSCHIFVTNELHAKPIDFKNVDINDHEALSDFFEHCNDADDDEYKNVAVDYWRRNGSAVFGCFSEPIKVNLLKQSRWFEIAHKYSESVSTEYTSVCVIRIDDQILPCTDIENEDIRLGNEDSDSNDIFLHALNNIVKYEHLSINTDNLIDYLKDVYGIWNSTIYGGLFYTNVEQQTAIKELYADGIISVDVDDKLRLFNDYCKLPEITSVNPEYYTVTVCNYYARDVKCMSVRRDGISIHHVDVYKDGSIIENQVEYIDF